MHSAVLLSCTVAIVILCSSSPCLAQDSLTSSAIDPYDWSRDPKGVWIPSEANSISCLPYCIPTFFSMNGTVFMYGRSQPIPGADRWSGSGIWKWNGTAWERIMNSLKYGTDAIRCSNKWCYCTHVAKLYRFNPLEANSTLRVYHRIPDPAVVPQWPSAEFSSNFFVDPLDRYVWFLGGLGNTHVYRLDPNKRFKWELLVSTPMTPRYVGGYQWIIATSNLDVYTLSAWNFAVFRWSHIQQRWHNITYNLDMRNRLGKCCYPAESLATDGEIVYVSTEQGSFRFRGDTWEKITAHWGNVDILATKNYLFEQGARWVLPGPSSGMQFKSAPGFRHRYLHTHNGGRVLFGMRERYDPSDPTGTTVILDGISRFVFPTSNDPEFNTIPTATYNFNLELGTYMGSSGADSAVGAGVAKNSTGHELIVLAANFASGSPSIFDPAPQTQNFPGATDSSRGFLMISSSQAVNRIIRIADGITHMRVSRNGRYIAVATTSGSVLLMNAGASQTLWTASFNDRVVYRVAPSDDGAVAILARLNSDGYRRWLHVFSTIGAEISRLEVTTTTVADVAISATRVWICGFSQIDPILQRPMLRAFNPQTLEQTYTLWNFDLPTHVATDNMADSRIYQLHYGLDGFLYMLGESAGGNSVFRFDGFNLSKSTLRMPDAYTHPFNTNAAAHLLFYARINPETGVVLAGQYRFPRIPAGFKANTMKSADASIAVNSRGELYIAGVSACCSPARLLSRVGCEKTGEYSGGDSYLVIVSQDFSSTLLWTPLNRDAGSGPARGIAVGETYAAAWFESRANVARSSNLLFTTPNAPFRDRIGVAKNSTDLWLGIWRINQERSDCSTQILRDEIVMSDPDHPQRNVFELPTQEAESVPNASVSSTASSVTILCSLSMIIPLFIISIIL